MSKQLPQEKQNQIVKLRQAGKTYSQITRELGVNGPQIAKYLKKAGLTKRASPFTAPNASSPQPSGPPEPAPARTSGNSSAPIASAPGDLSEFQPPAPPVPPKPKESPTCRCEHCGAQFRLDPGEDVATVKCPGCGK